MKQSNKVVRFGITMDPDLLERLDNWVKNQAGYSRSRAIRDIVRQRLVMEEWNFGETVIAATINLVYNHHVHETMDSLTNIQHGFLSAIVGTVHIHLDADICFEVIILRGSGNVIRKLADELMQVRGVLHCTVSPATTRVDNI